MFFFQPTYGDLIVQFCNKRFWIPGIKALADMLTTGESVADYEKRRRTINSLPSGRKRKILPAYDPVILSKVTKVQ